MPFMGATKITGNGTTSWIVHLNLQFGLVWALYSTHLICLLSLVLRVLPMLILKEEHCSSPCELNWTAVDCYLPHFYKILTRHQKQFSILEPLE